MTGTIQPSLLHPDPGALLADFVLEGQGELRRWLLLGLVSALESLLSTPAQAPSTPGYDVAHLVLRTGLDGREVEPSLTAISLDHLLGQFALLAPALRSRQCHLLIDQQAPGAQILVRRLLLERALLGWIALEALSSAHESPRLTLASALDPLTGCVRLDLHRTPGIALASPPPPPRQDVPPAVPFLRDLCAEWNARVSFEHHAPSSWTISIALPLAPSAPAPAKTLRVLLLERDLTESQRFLEAVYAAGATGVAVSNAETALRLIEESTAPFDLAVCDESALTSDGTKLYRLFRHLSPSTELVLTRAEDATALPAPPARWRLLHRPYAASAVAALLDDVRLERCTPARILVLGADPLLRRFASALAAEEGHEVTDSPSWDDLLDGAFDLAIVDYSTLRHHDSAPRRRSTPSATRVLALLDRPADWYAATYTLGADAVLPKPLDPLQLRAQIRSLLGPGPRAGSAAPPLD